MAMQVLNPGSRYGILAGSDLNRGANAGTSALYQGVYGVTAAPDPWDLAGQDRKQQMWDQQDDDRGRRNRLYDQLLKGLGGNQGYTSSTNYSSYGNMIPQPGWASTAPIWTQQQINAQAGNQRAQMQAGAENQVRHYATSAAQRGFSPMSPLTQFMQQTAGQRANIGAAQNESQLNWNAAEGNRGAQQRGEGINAGLYGSYTSALARARDQQMQQQAQGYGQQMDQYRLLSSLLGRG